MNVETTSPHIVVPEDVMLRMFEPSIIVPEQHRDRVAAKASDRASIRLMLAVLADAIVDYQRDLTNSPRENRRLFREARDWIESADSSWPFSFVNICRALGFDPGWVRQGLAVLREAQRSGDGACRRKRWRDESGSRHLVGEHRKAAA